MNQELTIPRRYCGPETSANGGYACGAIARAVGEPVEVTLRSPPPLDTPMGVEESEGRFFVRAGETLVAEARRLDDLTLEIPTPPTYEQAAQAARIADPHPLPHCFVCGPLREAPDGLRIFPAPVKGHDLIAAPWEPDESLADEEGVVPSEVVWAALDCPSGIVFWALRGWTGAGVLGRMAVRQTLPVRAGHRYFVIGWAESTEGRKGFGGSAIFSEAGEMHAFAKSTWVRLG